jgi:AhpD family alkylhydroperoxidase
MARLPPPATTSSDPLARSLLGHLPASLAAFQRLYGTLWRSPVLDPVTKEIARMRNARVTGCGYCKNVRFAPAKEAGLGEETLALVTDAWASSSLPERHKAALRFADVFLTDPTALRDADRVRLLAQFSPAEIAELAVGLALFMGFSKIAVVLGTAPASMPVTVVPAPDAG